MLINASSCSLNYFTQNTPLFVGATLSERTGVDKPPTDKAIYFMEQDYSKYVNQKFGRLTILSIDRTDKKRAKANCLCDCGIKKTNCLYKVITGHTKSCGCLLKDLQNNGGGNKRHGYASHRLHRLWSHMKGRCQRESDPKYYTYGARGITVCKEWSDDFSIFLKWALANGYKENLSLERINVNGNYEPNNCTWIPMSDQGRNKQSTIYFTHNGETHRIRDWCDKTGLPYGTIQSRIKRGLTETEILEPIGKLRRRKKIMICDRRHKPLMIVESLNMAALVTKSHLSGVSFVLSGTYKQWHGFVFKYYNKKAAWKRRS